jgi:hypothetical protein
MEHFFVPNYGFRKNSCNIFLLGLKIIKTNIIYYEWKINQALLQ